MNDEDVGMYNGVRQTKGPLDEDRECEVVNNKEYSVKYDSKCTVAMDSGYTPTTKTECKTEKTHRYDGRRFVRRFNTLRNAKMKT